MRYRLLDRIDDLEIMVAEMRKVMRTCDDPELLQEFDVDLGVINMESFKAANEYYPQLIQPSSLSH